MFEAFFVALIYTIIILLLLCAIISWWMSRPTAKHKAEWLAHKKQMADWAPNPKSKRK